MNENSNNKKIVEVNTIEDTNNRLPSEEEIKEYVLYFMRTSQDNFSINIKEFIPLYGFEGQTTGYYVTFRNVMGLKGYVLVSLISGENPIVEFSFESDGIVGEYLEENQNDYSVITQESEVQEKRIIFQSKIGSGSNYIKALKIFGILKNQGYGDTTGSGVPSEDVLKGYYAFLGACDQYDSTGQKHSVWAFKEISGGDGFELFDKTIREMCPIHVSLKYHYGSRGDRICAHIRIVFA